MTVVDSDASARVRATMRSIAEHAHAANRERAARLTAAFDVAVDAGLAGPEQQAAAEVAHQLVGSAGTFGFPVVSELASALEHFFADYAVGDPERVEAARRQLMELQTQLAGEPADYIDGT